MSDIGVNIQSWWSRELANRDNGQARALAARLRRAGDIEALAERAVLDLGQELGLRDGARLSRLVRLLAEIRETAPDPLPRRLGGAEPVLSTARLQRLLRAEGDELVDTLRRALVMADRRANVAAFGADVLFWGDAVKTRWCFQYFGADAPRVEVTA